MRWKSRRTERRRRRRSSFQGGHLPIPSCRQNSSFPVLPSRPVGPLLVYFGNGHCEAPGSGSGHAALTAGPGRLRISHPRSPQLAAQLIREKISVPEPPGPARHMSTPATTSRRPTPSAFSSWPNRGDRNKGTTACPGNQTPMTWLSHRWRVRTRNTQVRRGETGCREGAPRPPPYPGSASRSLEP